MLLPFTSVSVAKIIGMVALNASPGGWRGDWVGGCCGGVGWGEHRINEHGFCSILGEFKKTQYGHKMVI